MKKRGNNPYFYWGLTAFLVLAACIVLFLILFWMPELLAGIRTALQVLSPVLYGLAFAYLLSPLVSRVERRTLLLLKRRMKHERMARSLSRALGIFAALALIILVVVALLALVLPELGASIARLIIELPDNYDHVVEWVTKTLADNPTLAAWAQNAFDFFADWLYNDLLPNARNYLISLTSSVVSIVRGIVNLVIGLVVSVYVLSSRETFISQAKKLCCALMSKKHANHFFDTMRYANRMFGGFITGKLLDSTIIGILCFLIMSILQLPYAALISVIIGVTNIIPFFGPYIGAIPSAFLILLISPVQCLYFLIFILILQQFDGNILGPRILGNATGLSGFWVLVSILVFGKLFGVVGMIIGVPTFAVLYSLVEEQIHNRLARKHIDPEQDFYELRHVDLDPEDEETRS